MKFILEIDCDNDVFRDSNDELARILRRIAFHVENITLLKGEIVFDINGNNVGTMRVIDEN
jgi:hypothetical protein